MEAGSALSETSLALAFQKLREMKDNKGKQLNLVPKVLLVTPKKEFDARKLIHSAEIAAAAGQPTGNALQNAVQIEVEARINTAGGVGGWRKRQPKRGPDTFEFWLYNP
jgi:hypothetical protein